MKKITGAFVLALSFCSVFPAAAFVELAPSTNVIEANIAGPAVDFGLVSVGSSAQTVIGGQNNSPYTLHVYAALGGPDAGDFSIINNCASIPLIPGASCFGTIIFNPKSVGPKNAELILVLRGTQETAVVFTAPGANGEFGPAPMATTNQFLHIETRALSGTGK